MFLLLRFKWKKSNEQFFFEFSKCSLEMGIIFLNEQKNSDEQTTYMIVTNEQKNDLNYSNTLDCLWTISKLFVHQRWTKWKKLNAPISNCQESFRNSSLFYLILYFWSLFRDFKSLISCLDPKSLIPNSWSQILDPLFLIPNPWFLICDPKSLIPTFLTLYSLIFIS